MRRLCTDEEVSEALSSANHMVVRVSSYTWLGRIIMSTRCVSHRRKSVGRGMTFIHTCRHRGDLCPSAATHHGMAVLPTWFEM